MEWKFDTKGPNSDDVGFKDNDIEKFNKNAARSLVREAFQNSLDAFDDKSGHEQVVIKVLSKQIDKSSLDGFSEVEAHIKQCIRTDNDDAENEEVQRHIDAFEIDTYTCLEISDYNTTGMGKTPFMSLTQGLFKSTKQNKSSQGSKGVGKAAYLASSYLRTMLVTSMNEEGIRHRGTTKIATHPNPNNSEEELNYRGLYGDLNIKEPIEISEPFRREEKGTSIFIMGFWNESGFIEEIIVEVLRNYWLAIMQKQLKVLVEDKWIDDTNVGVLIHEYFLDFKDYRTGDKQNPRAYYDAVINGTLYESQPLPHVGVCKLWLYKKEGLPGYVSRFRKSRMLIYKTREVSTGFAGVLLCEDKEGNILLKEIENDEHNEWKPSINKRRQLEGKEALVGIREFITEKYQDYSGIHHTDSFTIDILDDLISFNDEKKASQKKKENKTKVINNPSPTGITRDRIINEVHSSVTTTEGKRLYKLSLDCSVAKNDQLFKVSISTDSSLDEVYLLSVSHGTIKEGPRFEMDVKEGKNEVYVELDCPFLVAPTLTAIN